MSLGTIDRLQKLLGRVERNAKVPRQHTQGLGAFIAAGPSGGAAAAPVAQPAVTQTKPQPTAPATTAPVRVELKTEAKPKLETKLEAKISATDVAVSLPPDEAASLPPVSLSPELLESDVESVSSRRPNLEMLDDEPTVANINLEKLAAAERRIAQQRAQDQKLDKRVEKPADALAAQKQAAELRDAEVESLLGDDLPIEDVSVDDIAVEVTSAITSEVPSEPPAAGRAAAGPSITPYTAPPSLDELTFSEPPPAISSSASPPSSEEIEPPPISAAHAVSEAPDSIDAALLAASEAQSEAPAQTPPPESGPQITVPAMNAPAMPTRTGDSAARRGTAPTAEQLGDVIELDQSSGPPLELAEPPPVAKKPTEELEFVPQSAVPSRPIEAREPLQTLVGGFTEEFDTGSEALDTPPPPARVVVPRLAAAPPPPVAVQASAAPALAPTGGFGDEAPTASSLLAPEVIVRGPVAARPVIDVIAAARAFRPHSFAELLDASIGLLKK